MDTMEQKQRAANMRLLTAMAGGGMQNPQQTPNYAAIPLQVPNQPQPQTPSPFDVPYTGLRNSGPNYSAGNLPPFTAPGSYGDYMMPPMGAPRPEPGSALPQQAAAAPMPQMPPVQVEAPAMDPRTMGDADLGGYGGNMGQGAPMPAPAQYGHLNPTPSLEEVFRREYAANPAAFGKLFG